MPVSACVIGRAAFRSSVVFCKELARGQHLWPEGWGNRVVHRSWLRATPGLLGVCGDWSAVCVPCAPFHPGV